ncbi:MAG: Right handed beta helix region [Bacillales bacterium]|jgi:parallel beta-helix repeat protein|nr:Right handed beta helix region [Bacillales bacterium]
MNKNNVLNFLTQMQPIPSVYNEGFSQYESVSKLINIVNTLINDMNTGSDEIADLGNKKVSLSDFMELDKLNYMGKWRGFEPIETEQGMQIMVNLHDDLLKNVWKNASKYLTLQEAINDSSVLIVPSGTYEIDGTLNLKNGLTLITLGEVIIKPSPIFAPTDKTYVFDYEVMHSHPLVSGEGLNNVKIIGNFIFDGDKVNRIEANVPPLYFDNCSYIKLIGIKAINNKSGDGSFGTGTIFFNECENITINDCEADIIDGEGLLLRNCVKVRVNGGEYQNSSSSCIGTQYGSDIIIDGVIAHTSNGSTISVNSDDSKVINSTVYDCNGLSHAGINFGHRTTYLTRKSAHRSTAENNHVYDCYAIGINLNYGKDMKILNNNVHDCNGAYAINDLSNAKGGINASYWADEFIIEGNTVDKCNRGIYVEFNAKDIANGEYTYGRSKLLNNNVKNNKLSGITALNVVIDVDILNNTIYNNNVDQSVARAEILISFTGSTPDEIFGGIRVKGNKIGDRLSEVIDVNGILIGFTTEEDILTYPVIVEDNEIYNFTNDWKLNGYTLDNIVVKDNYIDGKLETNPRFDITTVTANAIDIGYARYIRLNVATVETINTINHKHSVGTEILLQGINTNVTLTDSALLLNGNFVTANNAMLRLIWTGGAWVELGRCVS